ncbi:hypothetical protein FO519_005600 [Halicephalobus sp. NKZ332]|nr:hypothetical protein FO519_005600 [Halicephalobus sp. NKZ332]
MLSPEAIQNLIVTIEMCYMIPSTLLYFVILFIMFVRKSRKNFQTSFYYIFAFSAFNNMAFNWLYYFFMRLMAATMYNKFFSQFVGKPNFLYTFFYMIYFNCSFAHCMLDCLLSFNRFSVLMLTTNYKFFWRRYLRYFIILIFLLPFIFNWHYLVNTVVVISFEAPYGMAYPAITNFSSIAWIDSTRSGTIVYSVCTIASFLMNLYVSYHVFYKRTVSSNDKEQNSQNRKMLIYSLCVFFTEFLCFLTQAIPAISANQTLTNIIWRYQFIFYDTSACMPPWFMVFTNSKLRLELIELITVTGYDRGAVSSVKGTISSVVPVNVGTTKHHEVKPINQSHIIISGLSFAHSTVTPARIA